MFRLVVLREAKKELAKIPKASQERIISALRPIRNDPFAGKPLHGELKGRYSWRVWPYRIIYEIRKQELVVTVITIGHRQAVYK